MTLVIAAFFAPVAWAASRVIAITSAPAQDFLPKVRAMLSNEGRAEVDTARNAIIVSDTDENVADIERLIAALDRPAPWVVLRVTRASPPALEAAGVRIDEQTADGVWRVADLSAAKTGEDAYRARGATVRVHSSSQAATSTYKVRAGGEVLVRLGDPVRADTLSAGAFGRLPFVEDLRTGTAQGALLVTPSVAGEKVFLRIVPAAIFIRDGEDIRIRRLDDLATSVGAPAGGQVYVSTRRTGSALLDGVMTGFAPERSVRDEAGGLLIDIDLE
ncbi:hypothetical protein K8I61_17725 [bacterium]|nr:hypothetical protein [bacterium]